MRYLLVIAAVIMAIPAISAAVCPDTDDVLHGLNTQQKDFQRGKEIYLGGKYWKVKESQVFHPAKNCKPSDFFSDLSCAAGSRKLRVVQIPQSRGLCKYQIYIRNVRGVYGEFTLEAKKHR